MKHCPVCNTQLPDEIMHCETCQFSFHPMLGVSPEEANRMLEEKRQAYRKQNEELSEKSKDYLCGIRAFGSHEHRSSNNKEENNVLDVVSGIVFILGIYGPFFVLYILFLSHFKRPFVFSISNLDEIFQLLLGSLVLYLLFVYLVKEGGGFLSRTMSCISYLIMMAFSLLSVAWSITTLSELL